MSNGQMFRTTTHVSARDRTKPIGPGTVVTVADLDPAIDVGWQVSCGALVPIATNLRLVADAPTLDQLVGEIDRLQEIIDQQGDVIERQTVEIATVRAELAAAKQANPLHTSPASSGLPVTGAFGRDRTSANPASRAPAAAPPARPTPAVVTNPAGHVVANPDRPRTTRLAGSQPAILPRPGEPLSAAVVAANAMVGAVLPPAASLPPTFPNTPQAAAGYVPDPVADANAALKAENDAIRVKFAQLQRLFDAQQEAHAAGIVAAAREANEANPPPPTQVVTANPPPAEQVA